MNFSRFSFKQEAWFLTLVVYGLPAIGILAMLLLWLLGYLHE
jgi:hypothetical protein